jgi:protein involved in polysaccharide export with SLBB domain
MDRIIIDMEQIMNSSGNKGNILLRPGDKIYIPSLPSGISVMGSVGTNGTINYRPKKSVKYYLEKAGGYTRNADKKHTRLIHANGETISNGVLNHRVDIGDIVVVPTKIRREGNKIKKISEIIGAVTGILTTTYLISKL